MVLLRFEAFLCIGQGCGEALRAFAAQDSETGGWGSPEG